MPYSAPDAPCATIDDRLKAALAICGTLATEAADEVIKASVLLEANVCTSTNRAVTFQAWHGIDLPPNMVLPKIFTTAICKTDKPLMGFGFSADDTGRPTSVTLWFEGGSWIKTQCYADPWPVEAIPGLLDLPTEAVAVPVGFFEGAAVAAEFSDAVYLVEGAVQSHHSAEVGVQYTVEGLPGGKIFSSKFLKSIAPFATTIDFRYTDRMFFFGEGMRGVAMCIEPGEAEAVPQPERKAFTEEVAGNHTIIEVDNNVAEPAVSDGWN
jgi:hypothetical protein